MKTFFGFVCVKCPQMDFSKERKKLKLKLPSLCVIFLRAFVRSFVRGCQVNDDIRSK